MIIVSCGLLGSGKTLLITLLTYLFKKDGYSIYANYKLKGYLSDYVKIDNIKDFMNIETDKNIFALDEYWISADSRKSSSIGNIENTQKMLQSRKKKAHVLITVQDISQLDKRIRRITNWIMFPKITDYFDGKPSVIEIMYILPQTGKWDKFSLPVFYDDGFICDMYDTYEIINAVELDTLDKMKIIQEKYSNYGYMKKTELKTLIRINEKEISLTPTELNSCVDYIKFAEQNPEAVLMV